MSTEQSEPIEPTPESDSTYQPTRPGGLFDFPEFDPSIEDPATKRARTFHERMETENRIDEARQAIWIEVRRLEAVKRGNTSEPKIDLIADLSEGDVKTLYSWYYPGGSSSSAVAGARVHEGVVVIPRGKRYEDGGSENAV